MKNSRVLRFFESFRAQITSKKREMGSGDSKIPGNYDAYITLLKISALRGSKKSTPAKML
jgi:hypothetical protein